MDKQKSHNTGASTLDTFVTYEGVLITLKHIFLSFESFLAVWCKKIVRKTDDLNITLKRMFSRKL